VSHRIRRARRARMRRRRSRKFRQSGGFVVSAVAVGAGVAVLSGHGHAAVTASGTGAAPPGKTAAAAIAYARLQIGRPYLWGGTGPGAFDCSGLVMQAYASAGVAVERTSEQQWASEPHVSIPQPGDLVFFAGADGTDTAPGHVGIVVNPASHTMIDAYATGYDVEYDTYGLPASKGGLSPVTGFTRPYRFSP
jgi:cell wall-associated NlpC family hydrolase